jgi:cytosine/adenosine deaminase-related metal-dependent hydrolase
LIRNAWVVSGDAPAARRDILIQDGKIARVGAGVHRPRGARVVDAAGLVAMPGLVQAHVHLCQTLFRGLADDLPLLQWLEQRIWPFEGAMTRGDLRASARLGIAELLLGGTTTILDMGTVRHTEVLFQCAESMGIRYIGGKAMMDAGSYPGNLSEDSDAALGESVALCRRWHKTAAGRLRYAFSPRFVLSCSEGTMRQAVVAARSHGALLHTHAAENPEEVAAVRARFGARNIEVLHRFGFTGPDVLLAHCVWLSKRERQILRTTGTRAVHCPSANLKLGSGIAPLHGLLQEGIQVALGADGAPCNNRLDGFTEMRLAALLQAARHGAGAVSAADAFRLATRASALALGLADVGLVEDGMRADVILVDLVKPHTYPPCADLRSRLVYAATAADVHSVFVDGRRVVDEGKLVDVDLSSILADAARRARRLARICA